jgi:hypothetical protein
MEKTKSSVWLQKPWPIRAQVAAWADAQHFHSIERRTGSAFVHSVVFLVIEISVWISLIF